MIRIPDTLARLERSEYTGENRCRPCTVVNVVIALVVAAGIGVALSAPVGVLAVVVFLGLIRLRGYLIPGTPTITRRYLPDRVLEGFGKPASIESTIETVTPEELTTVLIAADIAANRGGEFRVTSSFREGWNDRLSSDDAGEPGVDEVESILGADDVERLDDISFVLDGRKRVRWESAAALAADVAAAAELRTRLDGWERLETDERRDLLRGLRLRREHCPACGERVTTTAERLEHCCRRPRVGIRSVCEACDRPLVELVVSESSADPWLELAGVTAADDSPSETEGSTRVSRQ